jgi:hypothetical protein
VGGRPAEGTTKSLGKGLLLRLRPFNLPSNQPGPLLSRSQPAQAIDLARKGGGVFVPCLRPRSIRDGDDRLKFLIVEILTPRRIGSLAVVIVCGLTSGPTPILNSIVVVCVQHKLRCSRPWPARSASNQTEPRRPHQRLDFRHSTPRIPAEGPS